MYGWWESAVGAVSRAYAWIVLRAEALRDRVAAVLKAIGARFPGRRLVVAVGPFDRMVWVVVALAVALPASSGLSSLDNVLRALHRPDSPSYGFSSLAKVGFHPDPGRPADVVGVWRAADEDWPKTQKRAPAGFKRVLVEYVALDLLFMLAYLFGLRGAAARLRQRLQELPTMRRRRLRRLAARTAVAGDEGLATARTRLGRQIEVAAAGLSVAIVLTVFLVASDAVEDAASLGLAWADWRALYWIAFAASWLKTVLALVVLGALAIGALWVVIVDHESARRAWETALVLRAPIVLLAALAFLLFGPVTADQGADAMLRWHEDQTQGAIAVVFAVAFGLVLWASARLLLATTRRAGSSEHATAFFVLLGLGLLVLTAVRALVLDGNWKTFLALAAASLLVGLLNGWAAPALPRPPRDHDPRSRWTYVLLGAPLVLLGLALQRPAAVEWLYADRREYGWLLAAGVVAQLDGWLLMAHGYLSRAQPVGELERVLLRVLLIVVGGAAVLGFTVAVWKEPLAVPRAVGTVAVALVFLVAAAALFHVPSWFAQRFAPPPLFTLLQFRRTPVFLLALVWVMLAGTTQDAGYYNARTVDGRPTTMTVDQVLDGWRARFAVPAKQPAAVVPHVGIPMIFVATAGGGIRASYWTALALECIFETADSTCTGVPVEDARPYFFAASGVSGGSVGLAEYVAHVVSAERDDDWPTRHAGDDEAAPTLAWFLFTDIPSAFVARGGGTDRAEILERTWEHTWDSGALAERLSDVDSATSGKPVPLLLLNGTRVQDGCRLDVSILKGAAVGGAEEGDENRVADCLTARPFREGAVAASWTFAATQSVHALLCDSDVRLSTAALLSARFPWVSPSGRLEPCDARKDRFTAANVVDGGYFDTSAASAIVELWAHLERQVAHLNRTSPYCLVPLLVELDNHYAGYPAPAAKRPWETGVPIATVRAARNAREANARQAAALVFSGEIAPGQHAVLVPDDAPAPAEWTANPDWPAFARFAELRPAAHPGTEAPLGWALSQASREDLESQLVGVSPADNPGQLRRIHEWLQPRRLACTFDAEGPP